MNDENLIPLNLRSKSEQRIVQSAGGKASGKKRREMKSAKEMAILFSSLPSIGKMRERLVESGLKEDDCIVKMEIIASVAMRARGGDPVAAKLFLEIMGELKSETNMSVNILNNNQHLEEIARQLKQ